MQFKMRTNPSGQIYLPKEVRAELGRELVLIGNARAAVLFPEDADWETVLQSLSVIRQDLEHRRDLRKVEKSG